VPEKMKEQVPVWHVISFKMDIPKYLSSKVAGEHGKKPGVPSRKNSGPTDCENFA